MKSRALLLILSFVQLHKAAICKLSNEEYEAMPPIVSLDPFERCVSRPGGRYCTAQAAFVADEPSALLKQIQEYSVHTASHFNHTRVLYGTCLSQNCKDFYDNTTEDLETALEACLNHTVWNRYKLKVKLEDDVSCHEYNEKKLKIEAVDIVVAGVLMALVVCNAVGSVFDVYCYKQDGLVAQFLLCFSIPRNWERLTAPPAGGAGDPRLDGLKGINGIRAISTILVVTAHATLPAVMICENPKFIEDQYEKYPVHVLLSGTLIMQTFVFLSAFLLVYTTLLSAEHRAVSWRMVPLGLLRRWLRLTAPYAVVLAVTATWMKHFSSGPFWNLVVEAESVACRRNWWKHLLFVNNYDDQSRCLPHAWYVAADMQLYSLGVIIFVFCQSPMSRRVVLSLLFVIGLVVPALHTYFQDLDGAFLVTPSTAMGFFITDRTFNEVYKRGHTNVASYAAGMAGAYLLYDLQKNDVDASKYKRWRVLYWLLFPAATAMTLFCKVFYEDGPRVGLYHRVLAAALIKPAFGLAMGLIIVGLALKIENVYRGILEWRGWTYPARASYSIYLLHVAFVRVTVGSQASPPRTSYLGIIELIVFIVVVSILAAYLFYMTVEAPLAQLVRTCLQTPSSSERGLQPSPRANEDDVGSNNKTHTKM